MPVAVVSPAVLLPPPVALAPVAVLHVAVAPVAVAVPPVAVSVPLAAFVPVVVAPPAILLPPPVAVAAAPTTTRVCGSGTRRRGLGGRGRRADRCTGARGDPSVSVAVVARGACGRGAIDVDRCSRCRGSLLMFVPVTHFSILLHI